MFRNCFISSSFQLRGDGIETNWFKWAKKHFQFYGNTFIMSARKPAVSPMISPRYDGFSGMNGKLVLSNGSVPACISSKSENPVESVRYLDTSAFFC